jgi:hypothetical protein
MPSRILPLDEALRERLREELRQLERDLTEASLAGERFFERAWSRSPP